MAASMIAEKLVGACCGDAHLFGVNPFDPFGKKPTEFADEKKEEVVDPTPYVKRNFLNREMKFELSEWRKLPPKARKACEALGYTEEIWDNAEDVGVTDKDWGELTDDEKKNVGILGWEETSWETKYQETEWKDLPKLQKKAAKLAGYTQETWDGDAKLESLDEFWDDLSDEQQEAMSVFGWTEKTWNRA